MKDLVQVRSKRLKDFIRLKYPALKWEQGKLRVSLKEFEKILEEFNRFKS